MSWQTVKPRTLAAKTAERDRLSKAYRFAKRAEWQGLCEQEPRLHAFKLALRRMNNPREIIARLADSWLRHAPNDIRYAALRQIDRHANRMALRLGGSELNDPMPPGRNLYFVAKELLAVR